MTYELKCPKCKEETVSGDNEKSVKDAMARHIAKTHPEPVAKSPPKVAKK